MKKSFVVSHVVFYGRSLHEYYALYELTDADMAGKKILDCAAGTASFTAEATAKGYDVIACDPMYGQDADVLRRTAMDDIEHVMKRLKATKDDFNWDFYGDIEGRRNSAKKGFFRFIEDYTTTNDDNRYINAALPKLPFADNSFDIVLCGHFLFLYADRFPPGFTETAIDELIRICRGDLFIYPLHKMGEDAQGDKHGIVERLTGMGINATVRQAGLQFRKGADSYLAIKC